VSEVFMADAVRFPHLAIPFAITGAAAGWLSAGLVLHAVGSPVNVDFRLFVTLFAAMAGLWTGILLRRWALGKRPWWQLDTPDPEARPPSDSWPRHVAAILLAGASVGGLVGGLFASSQSDLVILECALVGGLCAVPFVPVLAAVLSFARRAQRARMGSIVAGSDRRAVWGVLAMALLLATLEALPDACLRGLPAQLLPRIGWGLFAACAAVIAVVLAADLVAFRRARRALAEGLTLRESGSESGSLEIGGEVPHRVDLGIGDDVRAQIRHDGAPYRSRERVLGVVTGNAGQALSALRGALRRGAASLAVAVLVAAAHLAAGSDVAAAAYEETRCSVGVAAACEELATAEVLERGSLPERVVRFFEHGCADGNGWSCLSLADLYRSDKGDRKGDAGMAALFEYRAAQHNVCPDGTRLVHGTENVCVTPDDMRF
jgi:MFS family permease